MWKEIALWALFFLLIGAVGIFFMRLFRTSPRPVDAVLPKKGGQVERINIAAIPCSSSEEKNIPISNTKTEVVAAFHRKILGIQNYSSVKFIVDDFMSLDVLEHFLKEVVTGESDITPAGKAFIEQYYGFTELASRLTSEFRIDSGLSTTGEVRAWLEKLVPMESMRFVEEARGNIKAGATLRNDLLPPDAKET